MIFSIFLFYRLLESWQIHPWAQWFIWLLWKSRFWRKIKLVTSPCTYKYLSPERSFPAFICDIFLQVCCYTLFLVSSRCILSFLCPVQTSYIAFFHFLVSSLRNFWWWHFFHFLVIGKIVTSHDSFSLSHQTNLLIQDYTLTFHYFITMSKSLACILCIM